MLASPRSGSREPKEALPHRRVGSFSVSRLGADQRREALLVARPVAKGRSRRPHPENLAPAASGRCAESSIHSGGECDRSPITAFGGIERSRWAGERVAGKSSAKFLGGGPAKKNCGKHHGWSPCFEHIACVRVGREVPPPAHAGHVGMPMLKRCDSHHCSGLPNDTKGDDPQSKFCIRWLI